MRPMIIFLIGEPGGGKTTLAHYLAERQINEGMVLRDGGVSYKVYSSIFIKGCEPLYPYDFLGGKIFSAYCVLSECDKWFDSHEWNTEKKEMKMLHKISSQHRKNFLGIIVDTQLLGSVANRLRDIATIVIGCEGFYRKGEFYTGNYPQYFRYSYLKGPDAGKRFYINGEAAKLHKDHYDSFQVVDTLQEEREKVLARTNGKIEKTRSPQDTTSNPKTPSYLDVKTHYRKPIGTESIRKGEEVEDLISQETKLKVNRTKGQSDFIDEPNHIVIAAKARIIDAPISHGGFGRVETWRKIRGKDCVAEIEEATRRGFSLLVWVKVPDRPLDTSLSLREYKELIPNVMLSDFSKGAFDVTVNWSDLK